MYMYICTYVCTHVAVTCLSHDLQEEYEREGIEWVHIDYFNNEVICKLIDSNPQGIFSIMDEECLRPGEENDEVRGGEGEGRKERERMRSGRRGEGGEGDEEREVRRGGGERDERWCGEESGEEKGVMRYVRKEEEK